MGRWCCPAATTRWCWCPSCTCRRCAALAYARATRPDSLEAITVNVDDAETRELAHKWEESDVTVPLKVIASPYVQITRPVIDYVKRVSRESPRTVVTVFIPEYVVGHSVRSMCCTTRVRCA